MALSFNLTQVRNILLSVANSSSLQAQVNGVTVLEFNVSESAGEVSSIDITLVDGEEINVEGIGTVGDQYISLLTSDGFNYDLTVLPVTSALSTHQLLALA